MKKNKLLISATVAVIVLVFAFFFLGSETHKLFRLGMNSTAHLMCTCIFLSEQPEDFCREYAAVKQVSPWIRVDYQEQVVDSRLFLVFSGKAKKSEGSYSGCNVL